MNDRILELVYESTKDPNYDYLLIENVDNFDWERFWEVFIICKQSLYPLYESFEKVDSNANTDLYDVIATNGTPFRLSITFHNKSHFYQLLLRTISSNFGHKDYLTQLQNVAEETSNPIMSISFEDGQGSIRTTNKLGNYAYSVIHSIENAIITSIHERSGQRLPDILYYYILKSEQRKLNFFIKAIENVFPHFKNYYIDENSDNKFNLAYFYV